MHLCIIQSLRVKRDAMDKLDDILYNNFRQFVNIDNSVLDVKGEECPLRYLNNILITFY